MENQTNYAPQQPQPKSNSSGVNTVLLIVVILIIVGAGYWWYTHRKAAPASNNPSINVDVNLPTNPVTDTTPTP